MGKSSRKKGGKKRERHSSPLSAHHRQGQRVIPPLLNVPNLRLTPWVKDSLPDFLWLCSLLTDDPLTGLYRAAAAIDAIDDALAAQGVDVPCYGRLTQFEAVPAEARRAALDELENRGVFEEAFPERFAHALLMYPDAPGKWLVEPWRQRGLSVDPEQAQRHLAPVIAEAHHGQSLVATRAKFIYLRGAVKAGKVRFPSGMDLPELLTRYPERITEEERRHVEPSIRAMFGGMLGMDDEEAQERVEWGQRFWRANWHLYACMPPERAATAERSGNPDRAAAMETFERFHEACTTIRQGFEALAGRVDPDLYAPDRYEVLTGIAARVVRLVEGAALAPLLWTDEYGASLMRSVIEAKILIRWLESKGDPMLYTKFKDYGRGRLKLLKLHTEEYIDSLDEVPAHLTEYLAHLNAEVNVDIWEEFQEISIDKTFSGITVRQMAIETGLKRDYDFVFAPASGTTHGDWTALDRYALARCRNPLHLWHRIPNFDPGVLIDPSVMEMVLDMAEEVIAAYTDALGPPPR